MRAAALLGGFQRDTGPAFALLRFLFVQARDRTLHLYRQDDAIIVEPLLTESPRSSQGPWQTGLEKLLVDLLTDKYLRSSISESEYPLIYETAFERYTVDERKLFRYARRRNAAQKIRQLIKDKTSIELRTETTC